MSNKTSLAARALAAVLSLALVSSSVSAQELRRATRLETAGSGKKISVEPRLGSLGNADAVKALDLGQTVQDPRDSEMVLASLLPQSLAPGLGLRPDEAGVERAELLRSARIASEMSIGHGGPSEVSAKKHEQALSLAESIAARLKESRATEGLSTAEAERLTTSAGITAGSATNPSHAGLYKPRRGGVRQAIVHVLMAASVAGMLALSPLSAQAQSPNSHTEAYTQTEAEKQQEPNDGYQHKLKWLHEMYEKKANNARAADAAQREQAVKAEAAQREQAVNAEAEAKGPNGGLLKQLIEQIKRVADAQERSAKEFADWRAEMRMQKPQGSPWRSTILSIVLTILPIAIVFYFLRKSGALGGRNGAGMFGKSKAKLHSDTGPKVTFDDVAGIEESKQELKEVVEFLKNPKKFKKLGAKIPRGVLLTGPPGTGKTLLARAVAGEAGVPFFSVSGSQFVELFVGNGAARIDDTFEQAKKLAKEKKTASIVFIDELDAVGRRRGPNLTGGSDEPERTLNALLVQMDGFEANADVIVIAATNRPEILDPALVRPGRFDRQVVVDNPDIKGRKAILEVHIRNNKVPLAEDVSLETIARATPGFSGADLANLVNEAALLAARRDKGVVGMAEFENARDKVMMGTERKSRVITPEEREIVAYHEAGHTLVARHSDGQQLVHKVSTLQRGRALGVTWFLSDDRVHVTRKELDARLATSYGGRVAEELILGREKTTAGAANDIRQATELAGRMVTELGFSDKLGPVNYGAGESAQARDISEARKWLIEEEVKRIADEAKERARIIIETHLDELHKIAQALLKYEELEADEIWAILRGEPIRDEAAAAVAAQNGEPAQAAPGVAQRSEIVSAAGGPPKN